MSKIQTKLERAALAVLPVLFVCSSAEEKIYFAFLVLLVFVMSDFLKVFFSRFFMPAFQIPFLLIIASSFLEAAYLTPLFSKTSGLFLGMISIFLLGSSSAKFPERLETGVYFFIFALLVGTLQIAGLVQVKSFYPAVFLIISFSLFLFNCFSLLGKRVKR